MALSIALRYSYKMEVSVLPTQYMRLCSKQSFTTTAKMVRPSIINSNVSNVQLVLSRKFCASATALAAGKSGSTDFSVIWKAERMLNLAILGIIPLAIAFPSKIGDILMATSIVLHQHWGIEAIVTDYVRPIIFGNIIPILAKLGVVVLSVTTLAGLYYFIYHDVGIANGIRKVWELKPKKLSE